MTKKIVVTGGSGGAGTYVIRELLDHGYEVLNLDRAIPTDNACAFTAVDLTDYEAVVAAVSGYDAIVHFAADPEPDFDFSTGARRFKNNTLCTYNVFNAACALGMEKVVWASSETILGFPFEKVQPDSVPIDESHSLKPQNSYSLSKVLCQELADRMNTLYGVPFIGLILSNVLHTDPAQQASYEKIPGYWDDPFSRKMNLWGYIDARDAARCARLALESDIPNSENFIVAAPDTIMKQTNRELMEAVFPGVPITAHTSDHESLLSTKKAARLLGWEPEYSWRTVLGINTD